jgi:large subunit ribosomal protein L13
MGRVASYAAKQALQGSDIVIVNSDKALISGRKEQNIDDFKSRRALNTIKPKKGPFFSKSTEKIMKRCVRGMLPDFRVGRGRVAFKKVMCYNGVPEEFSKEKLIKINANVPSRAMTITELSKRA